MSSGDTTEPAAARLRLLQDEFLTPGSARRDIRVTSSTEPAAPLRLAIYDHIKATVDEIADMTRHVRATAPATPRPAAAHLVYDWMVRETAHLDEHVQRARDALIYRQSLEHAILIGETGVIRRHPCPACDTWGLTWDRDRAGADQGDGATGPRGVVVCLNRYCADDDGAASTWTLAQLADDHVARRIRTAARAT
jgi:hypothetical protein